MKALFLVLMLASPLALASSPFDGSWKLRPGSFHNAAKPYVFSVDQNEYRCASCFPPVSVKPDGQFHEVKGDGYDRMAANLVNANTLEVTERAGEKVLNRETFTTSPDGSKLHVKVIDESGEKPALMQATLERVAGTRPEPGKHPVSGTWVITALEQPTDLPMTLRMADNSFSWSWNGQHYDARFDGQPVPIAGDPTHIAASVKKLGKSEVEETDTRDGVAVNRMLFAVAPDGKSINVSETDPRSGRTSHYVMDKEP